MAHECSCTRFVAKQFSTTLHFFIMLVFNVVTTAQSNVKLSLIMICDNAFIFGTISEDISYLYII